MHVTEDVRGCELRALPGRRPRFHPQGPPRRGPSSAGAHCWGKTSAEGGRCSEETPGLASAVRKASMRTGAADQLGTPSTGGPPVQRPGERESTVWQSSVAFRHLRNLVGSERDVAREAAARA